MIMELVMATIMRQQWLGGGGGAIGGGGNGVYCEDYKVVEVFAIV